MNRVDTPPGTERGDRNYRSESQASRRFDGIESVQLDRVQFQIRMLVRVWQLTVQPLYREASFVLLAHARSTVTESIANKPIFKPLVRPMTTTNDPRAQHKHYYDTPEGHDQPLEFMRNSVGNGAVGAAAGGGLQPGQATGGATFAGSCSQTI